MAIKSVELYNDYEIDLKRGSFKKIKSNKKLFDLLLKDNEIETEEDIFTFELIEACRELGLDFKEYIEEIEVIGVILDNGKKIVFTNLDIAPLWDFHEYCEEMMVNWNGEYLMLTAADLSDNSGIMAIYDVSKGRWIYSKQEANVRGMIYAPEVNKFVVLYETPYKKDKEYGFIIIEPDMDFKQSRLVLESKGAVVNGEGENIPIKEFNHYYPLTDEELESDDFTGCYIDDETILLWNDKTMCIYLKKGKKGYRYCLS